MGRNMENNAKWRKQNIRGYLLTFNRTTDKDVLDHLEKQPNKRDYLIGLIRKDMKEEQC